MRKLTLPLLIAGALFSQSAFAINFDTDSVRAIVEMNGSYRGTPDMAQEINRSEANILLIDGAEWNVDSGLKDAKVVTRIPALSDNLDLTAGAYLAWTQFKFDDVKRKVMLTVNVSFGDLNFELPPGIAIEDHEVEETIARVEKNREKAASDIASLLSRHYPVYKETDAGSYQQVGTVQLDGINLEFEPVDREIYPNALMELSKLLRQKIDAMSQNKLLSLSTYGAGADPKHCAQWKKGDNCSIDLPNANWHAGVGAVTDILKDSNKLFDFYKVNNYQHGYHSAGTNIPKNFDIEIAMENFAREVGDKSKIVLQTSIPEDLHKNTQHAAWQAENSFGGFSFYSIHRNSEYPVVEQVDHFKALKDAAEQAVEEAPAAE